MTRWLVVAPERADDDTLPNTAWIAGKTIALAPQVPIALTGQVAVRASFERHVTDDLAGVAFFGHGAPARLYDADRPPGALGPALLDEHNIGLLRGRWLHAFACHSGSVLATRAAENGVATFVGYHRPLDAGWEFPPSAEREFVALITCTTLALLAGTRDERGLRAAASRAADALFLALEAFADEEMSKGWIWLYALAQQLVDDMVVVSSH